MWSEPYLETCCRSALHRAALAGDAGRPGDQMDQPCLDRLKAMGLIEQRNDGRFAPTDAGMARRDLEILKARRRPNS